MWADTLSGWAAPADDGDGMFFIPDPAVIDFVGVLIMAVVMTIPTLANDLF